MIKNLPQCYRQDEWVNAIYDSVSERFKVFNSLNKSNLDNINFDTLDERGCSIYEKDLDIESLTTLEERRNYIKSRWLMRSKCDIDLLRQLVYNYFSDYVSVEYTGDAELVYTAKAGYKYIGTNKDQFDTVNNEIIPAHFITTWVYEHNRWNNYYNPFNWGKAKLHDYNHYKQSWGSMKYYEFARSWQYVGTRTWDEHLDKEVE